jgi:rhodanese-related sulfurtransferase
LRPVFATWLGWLVAEGKPLVVVRNPDQDPSEIVWQARKVGYDQIVGELDGGVTSWTAAGEPTSSIPLIIADGIGDARVLDIRQDNEFASGHLPGADHVELGALIGRAGGLPAGPIVVMCGHGERAMGAASLLTRAGYRDVTVLEGGPQDWAGRTGRSLEVTQ